MRQIYYVTHVQKLNKGYHELFQFLYEKLNLFLKVFIVFLSKWYFDIVDFSVIKNYQDNDIH
jgi:hypothetical protein